MNHIPAARMAGTPALLDRLLQQGVHLMEKRRPAEALPLLERAALLPGAPVLVQGLLAEALLETSRPAEARVAVDAALLAKPGDGPLLALRARIRQAQGEAVQALDEAAAAVMAAPKDPHARHLLATQLLEARRYEDAAILFNELLAENPEDFSRAAWLGLALTRGGRHDVAEEIFAYCMNRRPDARGVAGLRAQNLNDAGQFAKAAEVARAAIARQGPDAELCSALGLALKRLGEHAGAAAAFAQAAQLNPDDAYLSHVAAALRDDNTVYDRASDAYVRELFDNYADRFEASLFALGYRVPGLMRYVLEEVEPGLSPEQPLTGDILDLGCGTGLVGVALHDVAAGRMVGVDLSARMIESARAKDIYAALHEGDVVAHLETDPNAYAHIIAADVFCYFGALERVLTGCRARLAPGGRVLFTVERLEAEGGWLIAHTARYRHSEAYLREALGAAGLVPVILRPEVLRTDGGQPVNGFLVVARAA
jgi:predicted TPR repeat methyltransferase